MTFINLTIFIRPLFIEQLVQSADTNEKEKQLTEAKRVMEELKELLTFKTDALKQKEQELIKSNTDRNEKESQLREREKDLWRKNEESDGLKKEIAMLQEKMQRLEMEKHDLEHDIERKEEELNKKDEEISAIIKKSQEKDRELQEKSEDLARREQELISLREQKRREILKAEEEEKTLKKEILRLATGEEAEDSEEASDIKVEAEAERLTRQLHIGKERQKLLENRIEQLQDEEKSTTQPTFTLSKFLVSDVIFSFCYYSYRNGRAAQSITFGQ